MLDVWRRVHGTSPDGGFNRPLIHPPLSVA
jgi:hypothetical protein